MFPPSCLVTGEPGGSLEPGQSALRQLGRVQLVHALQSAQHQCGGSEVLLAGELEPRQLQAGAGQGGDQRGQLLYKPVQQAAAYSFTWIVVKLVVGRVNRNMKMQTKICIFLSIDPKPLNPIKVQQTNVPVDMDWVAGQLGEQQVEMDLQLCLSTPLE